MFWGSVIPESNPKQYSLSLDEIEHIPDSESEGDQSESVGEVR